MTRNCTFNFLIRFFLNSLGNTLIDFTDLEKLLMDLEFSRKVEMTTLIIKKIIFYTLTKYYNTK